MSSIRRMAFGFCLYCTYFTSKWISSLARLGPGCLAQRRSSRGLWGNQDTRTHFKSCLWTFFFQKSIWSRRLLPKAFFSSCPLGTWGHSEQIRLSFWEGDCVSIELSEPALPSPDELDSTAPEPRSPVSPPVNRGVFLTGLWEMKHIQDAALSSSVITLQGRFITATCTSWGRALTAEPNALMNLNFTIATGCQAVSSQKTPPQLVLTQVNTRVPWTSYSGVSGSFEAWGDSTKISLIIYVIDQAWHAICPKFPGRQWRSCCFVSDFKPMLASSKNYL